MIITDKEQLKKFCAPASLFEANGIIKKLEEELSNSKVPGVGLSANQVGIQRRICIIRGADNLNLVNPIIVNQYDLMEFTKEGCLSFPDVFILTKRFNEIFVRDLFHPAGIILTGLMAVITQHELSHLYGKTMFDYQIKQPERNEKCWCNSGRKYKTCHLGKIIG